MEKYASHISVKLNSKYTNIEKMLTSFKKAFKFNNIRVKIIL